MKVLVTGAKGMLGHDVVKALTKEGHVITAYGKEELNICNLDLVIKCIAEIKPDVVINCAAYVKVDMAESEVENAYNVNTIGPRNLAVACNKNGAVLLHISTDYIFAGESANPYIESDLPAPLNIYGKSKWAGEQNIRSLLNEHFIIRTQWLFGKNGNNFVKTMIRLADENGYLTVVNDQFGSPTYTKDLAMVICQLIKSCAYGTYHVTNSGVVSWYEFSEYILNFSGRKNVKINPCSLYTQARAAKRPKYSPLDNFNLRLSGFDALRDFRDALKEYIEEIEENHQ